MAQPDDHKSPPSVNPHFRRPAGRREGSDSTDTLMQGILAGDRLMLSRGITLVESEHPRHRAQGQELVEQCLPHGGNSLRLGITGVPGVGKSTFIEAFGKHLLQEGERLAVLTVDPSSQRSKGSILGDKTRMHTLAAHPDAFIRPSPSGSSLGGVARRTRETILLCEAAGYSHIVVETVGVGQSEVAVHSMVDFFLLLLLPGAGDELQGIKRGIVEMADLIAVNKADGERKPLAEEARRAYKNALHLFPPHESGWTPPVLQCSAELREGLEAILEQIHRYRDQTHQNGYFAEKRRRQAQFWLYESIQEQLRQQFFEHPKVQASLPEVEAAVLEGRWSSFRGADHLLAQFHSD